jgi:PhnB protein
VGIHPYLAFAGNCREAFTRYQEILGGELVLLPLSDMPGEDVPPDRADLVMHAALTSEVGLLMGADDPTGGYSGEHHGDCTNVSLESVARARTVFDALAEDGSVQLPLAETFFSAAFGMCTDRFGVPWMVTVDSEAPTAG